MIRSQRGTIDNRPVFVIVLILVAIGWANWPGGRPEVFTPTVINWLIVGAAVLALVFGVGLFFWAREEAHKKKVARALGSELTPDYRYSGWGQSSVDYVVPMQRHGHTVKVLPSRHSACVTLEIARAQAAPFTVRVAPDGGITVEEAGSEAAEVFLDERVRSNLARMARVGTAPVVPAVVVRVGPDFLSISRDGAMSVEETLLFLDLCWPVVDRALALCYGKPV